MRTSESVDQPGIDGTIYTCHDALLQFQGQSEAVNVLGIVVVMDDNTPKISDLSRKGLPPIAVEGIVLNVSRGQRISGNAIVKNGATISEGDCLLLHGFAVWFEKKTNLPRLCREENKSHAGTWRVWRKDDEHYTDGDLAIGKREWQELKELRRWWNAAKTCQARVVS